MLLAKTEATIQRFNLLKNNDRVVVALSGGADSVALVYLLNSLKKRYQLYLHLAHLNHQLRGQESEEDALFVGKLAKRLKLEASFASIDVKDFSEKQKLSPEEAGRKIRYDFLLSVAKRISAAKIALGHTQDDQAETVLMRFLRGSGIAGLRGIPIKRKIDDCFIIRPLIELRREEIIRFLSAKGISFRTDSSNLENLYLRNRLRNELLPLLEKNFNPKIKEMLVNFAENISTDFDFLQQEGRKKLKGIRLNGREEEVVLNVKKFLLLHKALRKLLTRLAIKELKGDVRRIDYRHWKELEDLTENRPKDSIVDLPGEISVVKKGENLVFYKKNQK